jgi:hypothetical protein
MVPQESSIWTALVHFRPKKYKNVILRDAKRPEGPLLLFSFIAQQFAISHRLRPSTPKRRVAT